MLITPAEISKTKEIPEWAEAVSYQQEFTLEFLGEEKEESEWDSEEKII